MPHLPDHYAAETLFFSCSFGLAAVGLAVYLTLRWFDRAVDNAVTFRSVDS